MRVLLINSYINRGSTGRIAEEIGAMLKANGHEGFAAYGRGSANNSTLSTIKIGNITDLYMHVLYSVFTDRHGFASKVATARFVRKVKQINPQLVILNNLHGYYINLPILFKYLEESQIPVIWILYDCWAFTGHCSYFDDIGCTKWQTHCNNCPKYSKYPSAVVDNSYMNFKDKRELFTSVKKMEIITHSKWLGDLVNASFLKKYPVNVIPSGINLQLFHPMNSGSSSFLEFGQRKIILGCASPWSDRKGLPDFVKLSSILSEEYIIVLIGLDKNQLRNLPENIIGVEATNSIAALSQWYSRAHVFFNPTYLDNFPTTNIESLACGTPVITYDTGGSPEAIDASCGFVVEKGNVAAAYESIEKIRNMDYAKLSGACRKRALELYDSKKVYLKLLPLITRLTDSAET